MVAPQYIEGDFEGNEQTAYLVFCLRRSCQSIVYSKSFTRLFLDIQNMVTILKK